MRPTVSTRQFGPFETILHFARSAATDGAEAELVTDHVSRNRCNSRTKRKYVFIGETGS
jgi:hypothetical protein